MIVDVVMFDDEFDMLDCRLYQLEGIVDQFIICEADHTFSGIPKPYHLSEAIEAGRYAGKPITVVRAETKGDGDIAIRSRPWIFAETAVAWWREGAQRSAANGLIWRLPEDTIVAFGDLDEIPRRYVLLGFNGPPAVLSMESLIYSTRQSLPGKWAGTVVGRRIDLGPSPHDVRETRWNFRAIENAGWHLSWFGGAEKRESKLVRQAHQELVPIVNGRLAEELPASMLHVDGTTKLEPYDGDVPSWIEDGHAPPEWTQAWGR